MILKWLKSLYDVKQIHKNPYLQYFLGCHEYSNVARLSCVNPLAVYVITYGDVILLGTHEECPYNKEDVVCNVSILVLKSKQKKCQDAYRCISAFVFFSELLNFSVG